ncbi:MAG: SMC family ATPase [Caldimicrobium sp.]|nr:SMC family ATPase [Caldimicrobium sp.]
MRPLFLRIKGLGPFVDAEIPEEAFRMIHEERVFLISGEIGAGKTTIFDAILFAIFGETSFPDRDPKTLISHLILDKRDFIPEVTFKFLHGQRLYKIIRRPSFNNHKGSIALWIDDKIYSQKATEVTLKLKEVFGLEGNQFKKIFLIPQGEYRKVLLSKPEDRKELFELLFDTEFISNLEEFFKERLKEVEDVLKNLKERELELRRLADINSYEELREKIRQLSEEREKLISERKILERKEASVVEELKALERVIELKEKYVSISNEISALEIRRPYIETLKEKVIRLRQLQERRYHYENLEKLREFLKKAKEDERRLKDAIEKSSLLLGDEKKRGEELKSKESYYDNLRRDLIKKEDTLRTLQRKRTLIEELKKTKRQVESLEITLKELEKREKKLKASYESISEEKEVLRGLLELKKNLGEIENLENLLAGYQQKNTCIEEQRQRLMALESEILKLRENLKWIELQGLAVELARNLEKGRPCPVCGSTIHPKKASPDLFFNSNLEVLRSELNAKERDLEATKKTLSRLEGERDTLVKMLPRDFENLLSNKEAILAEIRSLERSTFFFTELSSYEKEEKRLKEALEGLGNKRRTIEEDLVKANTKLGRLEGELEGLKALSEEKLDESELKRDIDKIRYELESYQRELKDHEERKADLERRLVEEQTSLEILKKDLLEKTKDYRSSLGELLKLVRMGLFKDFRELRSYWEKLSSLSSFEKEISDFERALHSLEKQRKDLAQELEETTHELSTLDIKPLREKRENLRLKQENIRGKKERVLQLLGKTDENLSLLERVKEGMSQIAEEKKSLESRYSLLGKIYNLMSGKVHGVSFHSYVVSRFLNMILKRANYYFSEFSFGRYRFKEGELYTKKFLLSVFDLYTGTTREAKTLSGGESFLATLSFALGTSDVLISFARRAPLETLLIDEGFGSLDENTLDKVTDILLQLSQRTGKLIGIISHIRELKERFPVQFEVIKTKDSGSKIRFRKIL